MPSLTLIAVLLEFYALITAPCPPLLGKRGGCYVKLPRVVSLAREVAGSAWNQWPNGRGIRMLTPIPISLATTSGNDALGGNNLATALFLNTGLYLAI